MVETEHAQIRSMAEQVSGRTLPGRTTSTLLEIMERNMGTQNVEGTDTNYTVRNPDLDTLAVETSDGAVTVTIGQEFEQSGATLTVTDISDNAATNNITVQTESSTPINGEDPLLIDVNGGAATVEYVPSSLLGGSARLDIVATVGSIL